MHRTLDALLKRLPLKTLSQDTLPKIAQYACDLYGSVSVMQITASQQKSLYDYAVGEDTYMDER